MTADRIKAWALLMQHDLQESGLFITNSSSAFEYLIDKASRTEIIVSFNSIPLQKNSVEKADKWRDDFMKQLEIIARNPWLTSTDKIAWPCFAKNSDTKVSLTLAVVPGQTPHEFFAGCFGYNHSASKEKSQFQNTLLGLVRPFYRFCCYSKKNIRRLDSNYQLIYGTFSKGLFKVGNNWWFDCRLFKAK
jgi:hypothetical protein